MNLSLSCLRRVAISFWRCLFAPFGYTAAQDFAPLRRASSKPAFVQAIDQKQVTQLEKEMFIRLPARNLIRGAVRRFTTHESHASCSCRRSAEQEAGAPAIAGRPAIERLARNFHSWLHARTIRRRNSEIADSDLFAVTQWLASAGASPISNVGPGRFRHRVLRKTSGQVRNAFHTGNPSLPHRRRRSPRQLRRPPKSPSPLPRVVAGVVSLHNFPKKISRLKIPRPIPPGRIGQQESRHSSLSPTPLAGPRSTAWAQVISPTIYNSKPLIVAGNDGTGQKPSLSSAKTKHNVQDVQMFRSMFGLPRTSIAANIILNGEDPGHHFHW